MQLRITARLEEVLRHGKYRGEEAPIYSCDHRKPGIGNAFSSPIQIFGACMGIDAVNDRFQVTGANSEADEEAR
jgi:hypothetical protein